MDNQIQTCKCGCFVFDAECKKCVKCGAEREILKAIEAGKCCEKATNSKPCCDDCIAESLGYASQYEEQSNKSAEETLSEVLARYKDQQPKDFGNGMSERCYPITAVIDIVSERTSPLQSRITQLEASLNESNDMYDKDIKLLKEKITEVQADNEVLKAFILELESHNDKYREALESLKPNLNSIWLMLSAHPHNEPDSEFEDRISDLEEMDKVIEQALNSKEVGKP